MEMLKMTILDMILKITNSRLQPHLSGPNELTHWPLGDLDVILKCNLQSCFTDWYLQIFLR